MATAAIAPFVPGAGPPPTTIPMRLTDMSSSLLRGACAEILEAIAERSRRQVRGLGQAIDPGRVAEVVRLQADHVGASHAKAFAARVNQADLRLAGFRLLQLVE